MATKCKIIVLTCKYYKCKFITITIVAEYLNRTGWLSQFRKHTPNHNQNIHSPPTQRLGFYVSQLLILSSSARCQPRVLCVFMNKTMFHQESSVGTILPQRQLLPLLQVKAHTGLPGSIPPPRKLSFEWKHKTFEFLAFIAHIAS